MHKIWIAALFIMGTTWIGLPVWAMEMEMEVEESESGSAKLHMHGYGELHYNVPKDGGNSNMDLHRMVWGLSYEFNDRISLHTEVDFEHSAQEMELEFAHIDFLITPAINMRAGLMLMPVGPLNEYHEPTLFYSVERPTVQKVIIPTTWQEGGAGLFGSPIEGLRYRVYVVAGLAGEKIRAKDGIRAGRGKGAGGENKPQTGEDLAIVARLEYSPISGLDLGASYYNGKVDQLNNIAGDPSVAIMEGDVRVRISGIDFRALYAKVDIDDANQINAAFSNNVAEEMVGWYVELAYHLGQALQTDWDLVPFYRMEEANTQDVVPAGVTAELQYNQKISTYGLAFFPHPQVALKVDFQNIEDDAGGDADQYNLGMAYMF